MDGRQAAPSRPPNPALPYREDCWSEGETSVLIDAWGDRYVELNRGNLRQKQWQEVADAVNSRPCDARRPPRTDVQCKNRIDTLKKKYKVEKSKIADGTPSSPWIFYDRLDTLIGPSSSTAPPKRSTPPQNSVVPMALPLPSHRKGFPLPTATAVRPLESSKDKIVNDLIYNSYRGNDEDDDDTDDESLSDSRSVGGLYRKRPRPLAVKESRSGEGDGVKELSKAVMKLAEVYEKVEMEKNRQMMEMERQRMEFAKSMEVQRLQMFVDSQVQMMKMKVKRAKHGDHDSDHYQ